MFNKGEGGFKDRDLYVWCANASDGIVTAHPVLKGQQLRDIKGKHGAPFGKTIMQDATERTIKVTTDWWPRPGSDEPLEKETFFTKVVARSVVSDTIRIERRFARTAQRRSYPRLDRPRTSWSRCDAAAASV